MTRFLEFPSRPRARRLRAASKSGEQDTRLAAQVTAVSVVTAGTRPPGRSCPLNQGWPRSEQWRARYQPTPRHDVATENIEARQSRGTACLPRRAGEWISRRLRLEGSHGERRVSTASVGRHAPGLDKGDLCDRSQVRNAGMISLAKSRICFSNKSGVSSLNRRTSRKDRARCSRPLF